MTGEEEVQDGGTVAEFLARLAARTPTPAGGAVAALCTAQAAALVAMVARYCGTPDLVERAERLVEDASSWPPRTRHPSGSSPTPGRSRAERAWTRSGGKPSARRC
jgi:hypothetical protein